MFIGHIALAFAAKKATPRVSLAMLLLAAQWADTLWPVLVALGIEHVQIEPGNTAFTPLNFVSYPYSHSLVALLAWGVLIGMMYRGIASSRRSFIVLSALVVSHWLLDYITHRPDMPIYPGGPKVGLEMWRSIPATMLVETLMYSSGLLIYLRATRPRDGIGRWGFISLAVILMVLYVANVMGGPPPSVQALWIVALIGVGLFTGFAWWVDRHREPVFTRG